MESMRLLEQQKLANGSINVKAKNNTEAINDEMRKKRSLGLVGSVFNRMIFKEVQDTMLNDEDEKPDNLLKMLNCELIMEKKICKISKNETVCKNYFQPQCFLYTYPRITITVDKH